MLTIKLKRKQIPRRSYARLQKEINSKCPFCQSEDVDHFEIHHIDGNPANNEYNNLLLLCRNCHSKITTGDIEYTKVIRMKNQLMNGISITLEPPLDHLASESRTHREYMNRKATFEQARDYKDVAWTFVQNLFETLERRVNKGLGSELSIYSPGRTERRIDSSYKQNSLAFVWFCGFSTRLDAIYQSVDNSGIHKTYQDLDRNSYIVTINKSGDMCFEDQLKGLSTIEELIEYWLRKLFK